MNTKLENFETYRSLFFAIAYRMLGSVMEAEDIVQDTYLRYQATDVEQIQSHKAFLSTITTRLCLDYLKSASQGPTRELCWDLAPRTTYYRGSSLRLQRIKCPRR